MKIFQINFAQNKQASTTKAPKYSALAPLPFDTVSFNNVSFGGRARKIKYSIYQKEEELSIIKAALCRAIENSDFLDAEKLSEETGLDIYVVKLRLSTNDEMRRLYDEMKLAKSEKSHTEKQSKAETVRDLLQRLDKSKQSLTDNEIAFYLGLGKEELLKILEEFPELSSLYDNILLKIKRCPVLEKETQIKHIRGASKYICKKTSYDSIAQKAALSPEIVRARVNEDDEFFNYLTEQGVYPPDIYPESDIEEQDDRLMDTMLKILKEHKQTDIKDLAEQTGLYPGTVMIRIKNNTALSETYNKILGIGDEN